MATKQNHTDKRVADPYLDRRSGEDRRYVHKIRFYADGGMEKRSSKGRRAIKERRHDCIKVTKWSSVCAEALTAKSHSDPS